MRVPYDPSAVIGPPRITSPTRLVGDVVLSSGLKEQIERTLHYEGGFSNHAQDPGRATKYGISIRWGQDALNRHGAGSLVQRLLDPARTGAVTVQAIRTLTKEEAVALYATYFWPRVYNEISDLQLSGYIFDMAIHTGPAQAHKIAQRSLRATGVTIRDDGALGPISIGELNGARPWLLAIMCEARAWFCRALVMKNAALRKAGARQPNGDPFPDLSVFLAGWLRRAYREL